jgi:hypothetical protein
MTSAPAFSTACAIAAISVTLGVSLTITGNPVSSFTDARDSGGNFRIGAETHSAVLDVGAGDIHFQGVHTFGRAEFLGHFFVFVVGLAIDVGNYRSTSYRRRKGSFSSINASTPIFCKPTALSMPPVPFP